MTKQVTDEMFYKGIAKWALQAAGMTHADVCDMPLFVDDKWGCAFCTAFANRDSKHGYHCGSCPLGKGPTNSMLFGENCCGGAVHEFCEDNSPANAAKVLDFIIERYLEWQGKRSDTTGELQDYRRRINEQNAVLDLIVRMARNQMAAEAAGGE